MKIKFLAILWFAIGVYAQDTVHIEPPAAPVPIKTEEPAYLYLEEGLTYTSDILDTLQHVSSPTEQRNFSSSLKDKYNSSEYDYTLTQPKESLWDKIERMLEKFLSHLFNFDDVANVNKLTEWIMHGIAVMVIGLVLYWLIKYLIGKEGNFFFSKPNKALNPETQTIQENIHAIDFSKIIAQYELENNYRYAVRYQFLHLLKIYTDHNLLAWDPDKTNADYIRELANKPQQKAFTQLARLFNYIWYGEFNIEKEDYHKVKDSFVASKQKVHE